MSKKIKNTRKLRKKLLPFYKEFKLLEDEFYEKLSALETRMEKAAGVEGIEFFSCDNEYVGIGNFDRTMELVPFEKLEREVK